MSAEKFLDNTRVYELWNKIKTALSGKQDVLTVGDGIAIEEGTIRVTTPVKGVTQAEYDGIPEEERKGLYVITDASTALPEGGEVHSTEETRIGTWIDGRPLYRKCYQVGDFSMTSQTLVEVDAYSSEIYLKAYGSVTIPENQQCLLPYSETNVISVSISAYNGKLYIIARSAITRNASRCYVIVEYIKTTDQGVSA